MKRTKNTTLDLLKLFSSYMVVFIHITFSGNFGVAMQKLARYAVPFFFLVSGFFSYQSNLQKIKKRIKHIFSLIVFAEMTYILFSIAAILSSHGIDELLSYLRIYTNPSTIANFLLFNVTISSGHLWYLFAILYVYAIYYFVTLMRINERIFFVFSFLLLLLHIFLSDVLLILGISLPIKFTRNFLLMGIPFFTLGLFIRKHENKFRNIPNYVFIISIVTGGVVSLFSQCYLGISDFYIGSALILFGLVVIFIKYKNINYPNFVGNLANCSTYIYIFHIMVSVVLSKIFGVLNIDFTSSISRTNIFPILVCIASTVLSYMITRIANILSACLKHSFRRNSR